MWKRVLATIQITITCLQTTALPSPEDYHVKGLSVMGATDDMYAGFMPLLEDNNNEGSYFFWLAKRRRNNQTHRGKDKLVVWLNGGPGCSSMVGMMWEQGPFTLSQGDKQPFTLVRNPHAWNEEAHMLFVEQPIRTGFSTAAKKAHKIRNEQEVSADFYLFLQSFLKVFTELQTLPFFITGESYAGAYIPWMANHILHVQQSPQAPGAVHVNLQGVAIGNGQIDFITQEASYAEYAYHHGLIPLHARLHLEQLYAQCLQGLEASGTLDRGAFSQCGLMRKVLDAAGRPNEYNTNTFASYEYLADPLGLFHRFLNDPSVQRAIHVRGWDLPGINFKPALKQGGHSNYSVGGNGSVWFEPDAWASCNNRINADMTDDRPTSAVSALQFIARHIRVLVYSGEFDLNCNFLGTQHVLETNEWLGRSWATAERALWRVGNDVAGEYSNIGSFAFLIVRNSGHLLPMDVPVAALDMIRRFLNDASFRDVVLPSDESYQHLDDGPGERDPDDEVKGHKHPSKGDADKVRNLSHKSRLSGTMVLLIFVTVMGLSVIVFRNLFQVRMHSRGAAVVVNKVPFSSAPQRGPAPTTYQAPAIVKPQEYTAI